MVKSVNLVDESSVRSAASELLWHPSKGRSLRPVSYTVQRYIIFRAWFIPKHFKYNFIRPSAYVFSEMTIFFFTLSEMQFLEMFIQIDTIPSFNFSRPVL